MADVSFFDPTKELEAKRKKKLAEALMKSGAQPDKTEVVSGYAVKQSPLVGLAKALQTGLGGYQEGQADKLEQESALQRAKLIAEAINSPDNKQAAQMLAQDPQSQDSALKIAFPNVGRDPAALQIAAAIEERLRMRDIDGATLIADSAKLYDKGLLPFGRSPQPPAGLNPMMPNLIQAESGGDPNAVSPKGARGLTQVMPATAVDPGFGVQPMRDNTPEEQVRFGNDYLNAMQNRYDGDPRLAAAAYNAGPGRVDAALKQLPKETQNYVQKVVGVRPGYNEALAQREAMKAGAEQQAKKDVDLVMDPKIGQATKRQEAIGTFEGEEYNDLTNRAARMPQLTSVANRLSALGKLATYTGVGQTRDFLMRQAGMEVPDSAVARSAYISMVDNEVLPLLRETFGAQFTQKEGESLKVTLGDPNKSPVEKDAVLKSFLQTKMETINTGARKIGQPEPYSPEDIQKAVSSIGTQTEAPAGKATGGWTVKRVQ